MREKEPRRIETESQRKGREFVHYYLAPLFIAGGIILGVGSTITESRRIADGEFNEHPPKLKEKEGSEDLPTWFGDALLIGTAAAGYTFIGTGISLRRETGDKD